MRVLLLSVALLMGCSGELKVDSVRDAATFRTDLSGLSGDLAGVIESDLALADLAGGGGGGDMSGLVPNLPTWSNIRDHLLAVKCGNASCHAQLKTPMVLTDLATLRYVPSDIDAAVRRVDVFLPETSMLYMKVTGMLSPKQGVAMPKDAMPLSASETKLIADWITAGAKDN